jgi:hypothetical protein
MLEADSLQHSFALESVITLQKYKAGELDKDVIAQRFMLEADPALAKLVDID